MWFRHDSAFADDPRVLALVKAAGAPGWLALSSVWGWCSRQQTDQLPIEAPAAAMGPFVALGAIKLGDVEGLAWALVEHGFLATLEGGRFELLDKAVVWPEAPTSSPPASVPPPTPAPPAHAEPSTASACDPIELRREKERLKKQKQRSKSPGTFLTPPVPAVSPPVPGDMSPPCPPCPGDMSPPVPLLSPDVPGDNAVSPSRALPLSQTQTQEPAQTPRETPAMAGEGGTFLTLPDGTFQTPPAPQGGTFMTQDAVPAPSPAAPARPRSKAASKPAGAPGAVDVVLAHWASTLFAPHRQPKVTPPRRRRVEARLAEGFTAADLCKAVDGAQRDDFLMGRHPKSAERGGYRDVETVLRDAAQVERLIGLAEQGEAPSGRCPAEPDAGPPAAEPAPPPSAPRPAVTTPAREFTPEQIAANRARVARITSHLTDPPPVYVPPTPEEYARRKREVVERARAQIEALEAATATQAPTPEA